MIGVSTCPAPLYERGREVFEMGRAIRKALLVFLLIWLAVIGTVTVLATGPQVDSEPYLFSVIITDASKDDTVCVTGNKLSFNFGCGIGGQMFGFQPHSSYYYHDLVRVQNNVSDTIYVWYTLDGDMAELYDAGIMQLSAEDPSGEMWAQHAEIPIESGQRSGAISFYFHIPPQQKLMEFSGHINFHARVGVGEPKPMPPTGSSHGITVFTGLLLLAAGLWLVKGLRIRPI
jgi:hypothetical protein